MSAQLPGEFVSMTMAQRKRAQRTACLLGVALSVLPLTACGSPQNEFVVSLSMDTRSVLGPDFDSQVAYGRSVCKDMLSQSTGPKGEAVVLELEQGLGTQAAEEVATSAAAHLCPKVQALD